MLLLPKPLLVSVSTAALVLTILASSTFAQNVVPGVPNSPTSGIVNDEIMRATTSTPISLITNGLAGWTGNGWTSNASNGLVSTSNDAEIVSAASFTNFELTARALAVGDNLVGGIQFLDTAFTDSLGAARVVRYQYRAGNGGWGGLTDTGTRNRLIRIAPQSPLKNASANPQAASYALWAAPVVNQDTWNNLRVVVEYPRIRGWVNGVLAFDFTETDFEILKALRARINAGGSRMRLKAESANVSFDRIVVTRLSNNEFLPLGNPSFAKVGRWMLPEDTGVMGVNSHLLPNGKVLLHDSTEDDNHYAPDNGTWRDTPGGTPRPSMAALWDPETNTIQGLEAWFLEQQDIELFCSGHTFLPDGNIVTHGNTQAGVAASAWRATIVYDWKTNSFIRKEDTNRAGYYPTVAGTMSGDAMVFAAGTVAHGKQRRLGDHTEVYNYQTGKWRNLNNDESWAALNDILGDPGYTHRSFGFNQGLVNRFNVYFNLALMPGSGEILHFGGPSHLVAASSAGNGGATYFDKREGIVRHYGTHQIIGNGKVLLAGGGSLEHRYGSTGGAWYGEQALLNSAAIVDMNGDVPTTVRTGDMQEGRARSSSSLLADGSVIYTGGQDKSAGASYGDSAIENYAWGVVKLRPEIWDPSTGEWSEMLPQQRRRQYHSVTTLLPDGRIMSAGSGYPRQWQFATTVAGYQPWDDFTMEVFEPPYLFDANGNYAQRPAVRWAPTSIGYQHNFAVVFGGAVNVRKMHLIKLSSQTHSVEMSARLVELEFVRMGNTRVRVSGLKDSTIAPAGHYMLFVVNSDGVPSKGKMIKVDGHLSVHIVAQSSGDSLAKKTEAFVANQKVGTAAFVHGNVLQSWQMHHGSWTGNNYRFLSRHDGTALDTRFVTGWREHPALNTQKPSVKADALPSQTFSVTEIENGEYRIDSKGLTLDSYFVSGYIGGNARDELILYPYDGRTNHRYYIYPTSSLVSIRLVDGGGALTNSFGNLEEESNGWHIIPSSAGNNGYVKILATFNGNNALGLNAANFPVLLNRSTNAAATDWKIEYLTWGRVQLIHVQTGLALTSTRPALAGPPFGQVAGSAPPGTNIATQYWRLVN